VTIDGDFALTEVDQRFFNSSSQTVEGVYRFRTPTRASLARFGVDRDGTLTWGRIKEKEAAAAQYQSNVYAGSTEDPALLEWQAPGEYAARLYPIGPGETRRVVVRYTEWLGRTGPKGERREYLYPMAAEGAEESLPHIEELTATIDVSRARAREIRAGMAGVRKGNLVIVREQDFVPRADLAVELFDDGQANPVAYRARHSSDLAVLAPEDRSRAGASALTEADYVLVPVRARDVPLPKGGLDLAIVVDASAANEPAAMALARTATASLLDHLSKDDRVVVWAGADDLRPVAPGLDRLAALDSAGKHTVLTSLATLQRGGATDLGAMLARAESSLDPARRGAVVYLGDGRATVGELSLAALKSRLAKLAHPVRLFALGIGASPDMGVLSGLVAGGFAERVDSGYDAAETSLRLFEVAERPALLATSIELGPRVERVYPRDPDTLLTDETVLVIGRVKGAMPESVALGGAAGKRSLPLARADLDDQGDLRRRWAGARLDELIASGAGRAALVDLGARYGIVTPVTSFYVPTREERLAEDEARRARELARERTELEEGEAAASAAEDSKEGGTGTRAKGEEGSMGKLGSSSRRYAVAGPKDDGDREAAQDFGIIGLLNSGAGAAAPPAQAVAAAPAAAPSPAAAPTAPPPAAEVAASPEGSPAKAGGAFGNDLAGATGAGGLQLSGMGEGGGGRGDGIGLGRIGAIGHGGGTGAGQGFGSGGGSLAGTHAAPAPKLEALSPTVTGGLPPAVVARIVRQNFGRFRACYERGLARNPILAGRITVSFTIDAGGAVSDVASAGSDVPDPQVIECVRAAYTNLSFPQPPGGTASVTNAIVFSSGGSGVADGRAAALIGVNLTVDGLPRYVMGCGPASKVSLGDRVLLWRERLAAVAGSPTGVENVYRLALAACEAPTWNERRRLLSMMLDALPRVSGRVALWRLLWKERAEADALYRGLVARVKTPAELRELHQALGLESMDPTLLAKKIREAGSPAARVAALRPLVQVWPDDFEVALALMDALEDAGERGAARELANRLRARPDIDARVRTAVGELFLRLSASAKDPDDQRADAAAARRTFGEIVEYAPDDPVARRRLGDLLRAHGWYADAARQYETLAELAPDDPVVPILRAAAAEGEGQLEAAVRWLERAEAGGAPGAGVDRSPASVARALAATYLAWGRLEARAKHRDDELAALVTRAERVLADERGGQASAPRVRVVLTWAHPEFHPSLYSDALGAVMPAPEGDAVLGVAQVRVPRRTGTKLEVRLEPDELERAARLGAEAVLTVIFDEAGKGEKIVKQNIKFEPGAPATLRFTLGDGEVSRG
ncbi:MAG: AgmX/PglI C-terminal domain-containing protein, partial [Sorangiineae bacterium]|nr:AgmX/PglI C-terminal domain-containing protein [Sorangiineae bacterium]